MTGDGSVVVIPADEREPALNWSAPHSMGTALSTAGYSGQFIVLNVWGSWCTPCRAEAPELVAAAEQMPDVQLIGINTQTP